jgi:DNA-binding CsgD family transcriptional regulator
VTERQGTDAARPTPISPTRLAALRQAVGGDSRHPVAQLIAFCDQQSLALDRLAAENRHLQRDATAHPPCPLTERQISVLAGAANGETRIATARRLHLTEGAVASHRKEILRRTGAASTEQAIGVSLALGWLPAAAIATNGFSPVALIGDRPKHRWAGVARQVQQADGEWVDLACEPLDRRRALKGAAYRIRRARIPQFRPAGAFDAVAHTEGSRITLRARYTGLPATPTERASA